MVNESGGDGLITLQSLVENAFHGIGWRAQSGEQVVHKNSFTVGGFLVNWPQFIERAEMVSDGRKKVAGRLKDNPR